MTEKKYNLLFLFADQWRRESIGFVDDDVITPNIDNFAKDSLVFTNAVSTGPLCSPSRASILTGRYPAQHGVYTNCKTGLNDVYLKEEEITLFDVLKESGYKTAYIGKWHLDSPDENREKKPISGARDWDAYTPPGKKRHGIDFWYSYGAYDNHMKPHYWENTHEMIEIDEWSVKHETDKTLDFIEKNKGEAFSVFLSWNPPHTPLDLVPDKYLDMYKDRDIKIKENVVFENVIDHPETMDKALNFDKEQYKDELKKYYAAITGVDENFGRIIKYLKENNLYDNTIIVLTADHGEMFASHGLWSKHVWYEESIGVPFLLKIPEKTSGIIETVLSGVDIMPTLLSLLDLKIPKTVSGTNLKDSLIKNEYFENYAYISAVPGAIKAINVFNENNLNFKNYGWRAVRAKDYTYVVNRGYKPYEEKISLLYDNKNDKYQMNPIREKTEVSIKLEKLLKNFLDKYNDDFEI